MSSRYEIRVRGRVSETLVAPLGLTAEVRPVETVLLGEMRDSAELHSVLDRLDALGIDLVEFRESPAAPRAD